MPQLLTYDRKPVAFVEWLPNNAFGPIPEFASGEVCMRISPDEGLCDEVEITDEEADQLRRGEPVDLTGRFQEDQDEVEIAFDDGSKDVLRLGEPYCLEDGQIARVSFGMPGLRVAGGRTVVLVTRVGD